MVTESLARLHAPTGDARRDPVRAADLTAMVKVITFVGVELLRPPARTAPEALDRPHRIQ